MNDFQQHQLSMDKLTSQLDENLQPAVQSFFTELTQVFESEWNQLEHKVTEGLKNHLSPLPLLWQGVLDPSKKVPVGFSEMKYNQKCSEPNQIEWRWTGKSWFGMVPSHCLRSANPVVLAHFIIMDASVMQSFSDNPTIRIQNKDYPVYIDADTSADDDVIGLYQCVTSNLMEWHIPYFPYLKRQMQIILMPEVIKEFPSQLPPSIPIEISFLPGPDENRICFDGHLIWNISDVNKRLLPHPLLVDGEKIWEYEIDKELKPFDQPGRLLIKNSNILREVISDSDKILVHLTQKVEHFEMYYIFDVPDKSNPAGTVSSQRNPFYSMKNNMIRTVADIQSMFKMYRFIDGLELTEIRPDSQKWYQQPVNPWVPDWYVVRDFIDHYRHLLHLNIKASHNDYFAREKIAFIASIIQDRLPLYWVTWNISYD